MVAAVGYYRYYPPAFQNEDHSAFEKEVDEFMAAQAEQDSLETMANAEEKDFSSEAPSVTYFDFDPNNLSEEKWEELGLNSGQIRAIYNYESKGGRFRKKEDLKKMYVISEKDYQRLEPYIKIKETAADTSKYSSQKFTAASIHLDINTADTIELLSVNGIGPARARGVFKYRQLLGGYYSVKQLREVYGIDSASYKEIASQVYIKDTAAITKININTASADQMGKHPYIRKKLAEIIVRYRVQNGNYNDIAAIRRFPLVNDSLYFKLAPYLTVK